MDVLVALHCLFLFCLMLVGSFCCCFATDLSLGSAAAALTDSSPQPRSGLSDCHRGNASGEIVLLVFYPCSAGSTSDSAVATSKSERELLQECDLLTIAAINLAVEKINHRNSSILPKNCSLRVIPVIEDQHRREDDIDTHAMISVSWHVAITYC